MSLRKSIVLATPEPYPKLSPEDYLIWEADQPIRYEYLNGEVYAMTGGTLNHSEIATHLIRLLGNHLDGKGCRVLNSDAKVQVQDTNDFLYPDISITCDPRDRTLTQYIRYPSIIIEVLSPSTEAYDRGAKFKRYRRLSSLIDYVLVSSQTIEIDLYHKTPQNRWEIINYSSGETVNIESLNLTFSIEQIYESIIL